MCVCVCAEELVFLIYFCNLSIRVWSWVKLFCRVSRLLPTEPWTWERERGEGLENDKQLFTCWRREEQVSIWDWREPWPSDKLATLLTRVAAGGEGGVSEESDAISSYCAHVSPWEHVICQPVRVYESVTWRSHDTLTKSGISVNSGASWATFSSASVICRIIKNLPTLSSSSLLYIAGQDRSPAVGIDSETLWYYQVVSLAV